MGPVADQIAGEIQAALSAPSAVNSDAAPPFDPDRAEALLAALGGALNVTSVTALGGRLRIDVADGSVIDETALAVAGARGLARIGDGRIHVLLGADAVSAAAAFSPTRAGWRRSPPPSPRR